MELLKEKARKLGIELSETQLKQFLEYYEMLVEKNKVMNLTAITEWPEVVDKHFIDSLSIVKTKQFKENASICDLGTGAGFPGIPLKIAFPKLNIVLIDSLNKRVKFLNEVIETLQLENIIAIHGRAEELAQKPEYREQFDFCVSRAVANLSTLSEYCVPYVKKGGYFISYKSNKAKDESKEAKRAIHLLGAKLEETVAFSLEDSTNEIEMERNLIVIKKEKNTPKKYPRKAGLPSKEPL